MTFRNFLNEKVILPTSDIFLGNKIYKYLQFLLQSQWWNKAEIQKFQEKQLSKLLKHSMETVPYYKDLFNNLGIKSSEIRTIYDLRKLPILTKAIIKKEGEIRFTSASIQKNKTIRSGSSGSTGEPLFYINSKEAYSLNMAAKLRGWYWMGYRLGDKYIKLSQNPRKNLVKKIQDRINNNLYLATNPLNDSNYRFILSEIERFKPKFIRCYPDPLLYLARYKRKHPEIKFHLQAINATGNTLHPETRFEIEESFGCKIFDSYSCEGNSVVFECPTHTCYHSTEEYGISEVVDENDNLVNKGVGRLITTDLWNIAHPFIRYDTQDLVEVDSNLCNCGRQHLKIVRIIGRDSDVIEIENGRKFIVHNFTAFFQTDDPKINRCVDQFQIIKKNGYIIFRLVVNSRFNPDVALYIQKFWQTEMQYKVKIEIVKDIQLTSSGKRRFIINEKGKDKSSFYSES